MYMCHEPVSDIGIDLYQYFPPSRPVTKTRWPSDVSGRLEDSSVSGNVCKGDRTCECENARECECAYTVKLHMYINVSVSLSVSVSACVSVGVSITKTRHNFITVQYYQSHSSFANKIKCNKCNIIHCKTRKLLSNLFSGKYYKTRKAMIVFSQENIIHVHVIPGNYVTNLFPGKDFKTRNIILAQKSNNDTYYMMDRRRK